MPSSPDPPRPPGGDAELAEWLATRPAMAPSPPRQPKAGASEETFAPKVNSWTGPPRGQRLG
eukprot:gene21987-25880_t